MPITKSLGGETLRRLPAQAQRLPNRPSSSTLWRWANKGVKGILLETVQIGGITFCSDEALERFLEAINDRSASPTAQPPRSRRQRKESVEKAEAILERAGI